jgi:hypothetical protein
LRHQDYICSHKEPPIVSVHHDAHEAHEENVYGVGCNRDGLRSRVSGIARVESPFCVEIRLAESSLDKVLRRSVDDNA